MRLEQAPDGLQPPPSSGADQEAAHEVFQETFREATRASSRASSRAPKRTPSPTGRIARACASLALLVLGLASLPARGQGTATESPSTRSPGPTNAGSRVVPTHTSAEPPPAGEVRESLGQSIGRRQAFPFQPRCDGNTQEMVACLWQRRDRSDRRLGQLLGDDQVLERWRAARLAVCRRSAERGSGGSIQPLLGLGCENALNTTLIQQITSPLLR